MSPTASRTSDWDAVVTHSTFTRCALSPYVSTTALAAKVADLRASKLLGTR